MRDLNLAKTKPLKTANSKWSKLCKARLSTTTATTRRWKDLTTKRTCNLTSKSRTLMPPARRSRFSSQNHQKAPNLKTCLTRSSRMRKPSSKVSRSKRFWVRPKSIRKRKRLIWRSMTSASPRTSSPSPSSWIEKLSKSKIWINSLTLKSSCRTNSLTPSGSISCLLTCWMRQSAN